MSTPLTTGEVLDALGNEMVAQTIILWRIYDLLLLTLPADAAKHVAQVHEAGEFLGPNPSYKGAIDGE